MKNFRSVSYEVMNAISFDVSVKNVL